MNFYILENSVTTNEKFFKYVEFEKYNANRGDFPRCPYCSDEIGLKKWLPPYTVKLLGKEFGDMCKGTGNEI